MSKIVKKNTTTELKATDPITFGITPVSKSKINPQAVALVNEFLPELDDDAYYYHEIVGYDVVDVKHGNIGDVKLVDDSNAQTMLIVDNNGTEIMIPMDAMVKKVDKENKTVEIETPDGLLDLYI